MATTTTTLVDDVLGVRSLIDTPEKWVKNVLFADSAHKPVDLPGCFDEWWKADNVPAETAAMCIVGAQIKLGLYESKEGSPRCQKLNAVFCTVNNLVPNGDTFSNFQTALVSFNNAPSTTHAVMMQALDRTIEYALERKL